MMDTLTKVIINHSIRNCSGYIARTFDVPVSMITMKYSASPKILQ